MTSDKADIYIKPNNDLYIPVTVRLEWLPDGKIRPLSYWTPDGSYYEIQFVHEMTQIVFLKEGGEGVRFKVTAVLKETPEPYCDSGAPHEVYLYLADNFFCGRNIIDERYGHSSKEFITVTLDVFPNCDYELICFEVRGIRYIVDRTLAIEPRGSFQAGGIGVRHKVEARQDEEDSISLKDTSRMAALYFEINKWFIRIGAA